MKYLLESKDEIAVLPVLHLLVFLFHTMFLLLVILSVIKLYARNKTFKTTQSAFTCSGLTIETLEQGVKYVPS